MPRQRRGGCATIPWLPYLRSPPIGHFVTMNIRPLRPDATRGLHGYDPYVTAYSGSREAPPMAGSLGLCLQLLAHPAGETVSSLGEEQKFLAPVASPPRT
jgi:hypothetical protein